MRNWCVSLENTDSMRSNILVNFARKHGMPDRAVVVGITPFARRDADSGVYVVPLSSLTA